MGQTTANDRIGDRRDALRDDALSYQIGQKPVGTTDRYIGQRLLDAVIGKGGLTCLAVGKFLVKLLIGIAVIKDRDLHGFDQVVFLRQTA